MVFRVKVFPIVNVVLTKIGKSQKSVTGTLSQAPETGRVLVVEFSDGVHEYVTTPIKRILKLAGDRTLYIETTNSRYRLELLSQPHAQESDERISHSPSSAL